MNQKLCEAVEMALRGQWDAAHSVVQECENDPAAAWLHAVLHKIEGDLGNSRYWYTRAGKLNRISEEPNTELLAIKRELSADPTAKSSGQT